MRVIKPSKITESMTFDIKQSVLTPELKKHIYECFSKHAVASTSMDGLNQEPVSFEIRNNNELIGCAVAQISHEQRPSFHVWFPRLDMEQSSP